MSGDDERKLDAERSVIADLEHMDAMKAELAAWRKGPWVRKADHDEDIKRIGGKYHAAVLENSKLRAAILNFRNVSGSCHAQLAAERLFAMVTNHPSSPAGLLGCYVVGQTIGGQFGFKTPTGKSDGFLTRAEAERAAADSEKQDRKEAETGIGPIASVLRKYFAAEVGKAGAA